MCISTSWSRLETCKHLVSVSSRLVRPTSWSHLGLGPLTSRAHPWLFVQEVNLYWACTISNPWRLQEQKECIISIVLAVICATDRRVEADVLSIFFLSSCIFSVRTDLLFTSQYSIPVHAMPVEAVANKFVITTCKAHRVPAFAYCSELRCSLSKNSITQKETRQLMVTFCAKYSCRFLITTVTIITRHRASTTTYSLTFRVRGATPAH